MIYIIGVDHLIQYNGPVPDFLRNRFKLYLTDIIKEYEITLLAEEFSNEGLFDVFNATEGTVEAVAEEHDIEHRYCDPEAIDRKRLGIPYYYDVREEIKSKLGIKDKFILDQDLKKKIDFETNMRVKSFWNIREEFWLQQITDSCKKNILFICGYDHCERFHLLCQKKDIEACILIHFWNQELFNDYENLFSLKDDGLI